MSDQVYIIEDNVLISVDKSFEGEFVVPDGVVGVGVGAFGDCKKLTAVKLPPSCKHLETSAFFDCRNLKHINTENVEFVAPNCFDSCIRLENLDFRSAKHIGDFAMRKCDGLEELVFSSDLTIPREDIVKFSSKLKTLRIIYPTGEREFDVSQTPIIGIMNNGATGEFLVKYSEYDQRVLTSQGERSLSVREILRRSFGVSYSTVVPLEETTLPAHVVHTGFIQGKIERPHLTEKIKKIPHGIEVECLLDNEVAANVVRAVINGTVRKKDKRRVRSQNRFMGDGLLIRGSTSGRRYDIVEPGESGRTWGIDYDETLNPPLAKNLYPNRMLTELVTPILEFSETQVLSDVLQKFGENNAYGSDLCGIHTHTSGEKFDNLADGFANPLNRLLANVYVWQDTLYKALDMRPTRMRFCEKISESMLDRILMAKSPEERLDAWYTIDDVDRTRDERDHNSRHRIVNLHSFYRNGHLEFRACNTPHRLEEPEEVLAFRNLSVALTSLSAEGGRLPVVLRDGMSEKAGFDMALWEIGLAGDEFAATRRVLTRHLDGRAPSKQAVQDYIIKHNKYRHGRDIVNDYPRELGVVQQQNPR